jgi:L-lactate dehydrogenase complex protein LldG
MNVSSAKENILKKIRKALSESTPIPFPQSEGNHSVFQPSHQELEVEFAEQFTRLQGKFIFCIDPGELAAQLTALAGHQSWKKIVCREEKLQVLLKGNGFSSFSDIAWSDQLVYDIKDSLVALKEKYQQQIPSLITFATGPSRTADIEKTLVVGVHGPREVYLFLVDKR